MYFLNDEVGMIECPLTQKAAYGALLMRLNELQLPVETADEREGRIVVRCLTSVVNAGVWRCWSDKLLFDVKEVDSKTSSISVSAIPNLLRTSIKPGETVVDAQTLVSQLSIAKP
jgi:hypothetical protein